MTNNICSNLNRVANEPSKHIHRSVSARAIFFFSTNNIELVYKSYYMRHNAVQIYGPHIRLYVQCFTTDTVLTSQSPFMSIRGDL